MPRPWQVSDCQIRTATDGDGNEFTYFIETDSPKEHNPLDMPTETFSRELQSCDTTSVEDVERFTTEYGFMPSAVYDGKTRLNLYRRRFSTWARWKSVDTQDDLRPHTNGFVISLVTGGISEDYRYLNDRTERLLAPAIQSEVARSLEAKNKDVRGVISTAEAAQTIRLLQVACTLPAVAQVASTNKWPTTQVAEYLSDKRYMQQAGESYFLESSSPLFCGHRMASYDAMMEYDDFAAMIGRSELGGPRGIYEFFLGEKLGRNAQNALSFLAASVASYAEIPEPMPKGKSLASLADAILPRKAQKSDDTLTQGSPAEAIIWQFTTEFNNPTPFRTCANCGRVFKKYREERYKENGHIRETRFCRKSCGVVYAQRKSRSD